MEEKNKIENYVERVFTYRKEGPGPHSERLKGLTTLHASVDRQKLSLSHSSHIFTLPKLLYISGQASTYYIFCNILVLTFFTKFYGKK